MTNIDNTASPDNLQLNAYGVLAVGTTDWITGQEAAGQRQLVTSASLPTDSGGTDAEFLALGFTFGAPDPRDPMFRPATLPEGWSKQGSDHSMWSYVVDGLGRRRVSVFYKAAFYDRSAFMRLVTIDSYAHDLLFDGSQPVYDETWCTPKAIYDALSGIRQQEAEREQLYASKVDDPRVPWATDELGKVRKKLAKIDQVAASVLAAGRPGAGGAQ